MNGESDQSASFFKELGSYMKPYQSLYTVSILISVLGVFSYVASYVFVGFIAAQLFTQERNHIFLWVGLAAVCRILHAVLSNLSTWYSHKAAYHTLKDVRMALSEKMMHLPLGYFEKNGSGRLMSLMTDQVESMEKPLAHVLPEMTGNLLAPLALLVYLFIIDWRLGFTTLIWILLGFSVTSGMMKNYPEKFAGQIQATKTMNQAISEYVGGIEVIKNFGQAKSCGATYENAVYHHASYDVNWQKETQIYSALGMAIAPFSIFPVLIVGFICHVEAPTLFLSILLTMGIFGPLMQTMGYYDQLAQMGTLAKEMKDVLDYSELKRGNAQMSSQYDITFDDVSFSYEQDGPLALNHIHFTVPQNTVFALVGPSGSGKSTIAKLLAGYWDVSSGQIRIGNQPYSSFSQEAINEMIAFVDQDTFLFDKSVADNIRLANPQATLNEVMDVAKKTGCDEFIKKLEHGYESLAGHLSGGERQRISIARAMMKKAPILILDEATASSDPENEALIQQALSAAAKDKTVIVVAHHLTTIRHANQIAFLKDGHIEKIADHATLMDTCAEYKDLYDLSKEG